jgi:hypothetical protein
LTKGPRSLIRTTTEIEDRTRAVVHEPDLGFAVRFLAGFFSDAAAGADRQHMVTTRRVLVALLRYDLV